MDFKLDSVSLDRIDTTDHTFKITTHADKTDLVPSIRTIGLLQPPVLITRGQGWVVVCGFRRIGACEALGNDRIPACILPAAYSTMACVRIAIADNVYQRQLNVVEQSRAFALIQKFTDHSTSWPTIAQSIGLPASQAAMDRIMPVAAMPPSLQAAILDGSIALPVALQINELEKDDAAALCDFFSKITTGLNVQRELLALIGDISQRDDIGIASLIEVDDITAIMGNEKVSTPQKVQELRSTLKTRRYPELSKAQAAFRRTLKSLKLNPSIQLQPPRYFEGTSYRVTLTINSRRQLKALQPELDKLARHPDLLPE